MSALKSTILGMLGAIYCIVVSMMFAGIGPGIWDVFEGTVNYERLPELFTHVTFYLELTTLALVFGWLHTNKLRYKSLVIVGFVLTIVTMVLTDINKFTRESNKTNRSELVLENLRDALKIEKGLLESQKGKYDRRHRETVERISELNKKIQEHLSVDSTEEELALSKLYYKVSVSFFLGAANLFLFHMFLGLFLEKKQKVVKEKKRKSEGVMYYIVDQIISYGRDKDDTKTLISDTPVTKSDTVVTEVDDLSDTHIDDFVTEEESVVPQDRTRSVTDVTEDDTSDTVDDTPIVTSDTDKGVTSVMSDTNINISSDTLIESVNDLTKSVPVLKTGDIVDDGLTEFERLDFPVEDDDSLSESEDVVDDEIPEDIMSEIFETDSSYDKKKRKESWKKIIKHSKSQIPAIIGQNGKVSDYIEHFDPYFPPLMKDALSDEQMDFICDISEEKFNKLVKSEKINWDDVRNFLKDMVEEDRLSWRQMPERYRLSSKNHMTFYRYGTKKTSTNMLKGVNMLPIYRDYMFNKQYGNMVSDERYLFMTNKNKINLIPKSEDIDE